MNNVHDLLFWYLDTTILFLYYEHPGYTPLHTYHAGIIKQSTLFSSNSLCKGFENRIYIKDLFKGKTYFNKIDDNEI